MSQDGVMPGLYVWFCRDCETKGEMFGNSLSDNMVALMEHNISSPNCGGLIRVASRGEAEKNKEILAFENWDD